MLELFCLKCVVIFMSQVLIFKLFFHVKFFYKSSFLLPPPFSNLTAAYNLLYIYNAVNLLQSSFPTFDMVFFGLTIILLSYHLFIVKENTKSCFLLIPVPSFLLSNLTLIASPSSSITNVLLISFSLF